VSSVVEVEVLVDVDVVVGRDVLVLDDVVVELLVDVDVVLGRDVLVLDEVLVELLVDVVVGSAGSVVVVVAQLGVPGAIHPLRPESFPALSTADTAKKYAVASMRFVSDAEVCVAGT
jgi:hypothetical protein